MQFNTLPHAPLQNLNSNAGQAAGTQIPAAKILEWMGLPAQASQALLATGIHGGTLQALLGASQSPLRFHATEPGRFTVSAQGELPAGMDSLAQALVELAPVQALPLLAAALRCAGDIASLAMLASACVQARQSTAQATLNFNDNALLQMELRILLASPEVDTTVKLQWAPLLEYDPDNALRDLAEFAHPNNSSSSDPPAPEPLVGIFYAALLHGDRNVMDQAMARLNASQGATAPLLMTRCQAELAAYAQRVAVQTAPKQMPSVEVASHGSFVAGIATKPSSRSSAQALARAIKKNDLKAIKALLEGEGVSLLNEPSHARGRTALASAARYGHLDIVTWLLAQGVRVNGVDSDGKTPLHLAAEHGHQEVVEVLLASSGTRTDVTSKIGRTALTAAAQHGDAAIVKVLLTRIHPDACGDDGATPLYIASKNGHLEVVRVLLADSRTTPGVFWKGGFTALHVAAEEGHAELVKLLLERINPNACDDNGMSPLHTASNKGRLDVARVLLADQRTQSGSVQKDGATALWCAAGKGHAEVVKLLLKYIDPNVPITKGGATALYIAARNGHAGVISALLEYVGPTGSRVDAAKSNECGVSPLHAAAQNTEHPELVELFFKLRPSEMLALANQGDRWGAKPVALAAECGNDQDQVIDPLRALTQIYSSTSKTPFLDTVGGLVSPVTSILGLGSPFKTADNAPIPVDWSKGFLVYGHDIRYIPEIVEVADSGGITLDTYTNFDAESFNELSFERGAFALIYAHGNEMSALKRHALQIGESNMVPTNEVILNLYNKGVRNFTLSACKIGLAAECIVRRINLDPGWPKPVDPNFQITFVGGKNVTLGSEVEANFLNRINDFAPRHGAGKGNLMRRLTASSMIHVSWDEQTKKMVLADLGTPKQWERGRLTKEQVESVIERKIDKYVHRGNLSKLKALFNDATSSASGLPAINVNFRGPSGKTALDSAAEEGNLEMVKFLLQKHGANVNSQCPRGATPLYRAAKFGKLDVAKFLLQQAGIDANTRLHDSPKEGPLKAAIEGGHLEMVKLLWPHTDTEGRSRAMWQANKAKKQEIATWLQSAGNTARG